MRSVLSLATFAIGVLCFVAFVTKVKPVPMRRLRRASRCESSDAFGFSGVS
jgi:hypothetical protein